jgi:hypothetical protein
MKHNLSYVSKDAYSVIVLVSYTVAQRVGLPTSINRVEISLFKDVLLHMIRITFLNYNDFNIILI